MCELKPMFEENRRETVKEAIMKNDIPRIEGRYSQKMKTVIAQMLQKNPSDRIDLTDLFEPLVDGIRTSPVQSDTYPSQSISVQTLSTSLSPLSVTALPELSVHRNQSSTFITLPP